MLLRLRRRKHRWVLSSLLDGTGRGVRGGGERNRVMGGALGVGAMRGWIVVVMGCAESTEVFTAPLSDGRGEEIYGTCANVLRGTGRRIIRQER